VAERKHTILVVDDDEGVRRVLGQWVLKLGYELTSANSAEAAIALLETTQVDVALCDVQMPDADGIWLANRMRERFPDVAIVLVTGVHEMDPSVTLWPGVGGLRDQAVRPRCDCLGHKGRSGLAGKPDGPPAPGRAV
jgi:CheY-like chemotaxis protein